MKVYLVYRYDRCDYERTNLKVYKNEEDAKKMVSKTTSYTKHRV